MAEMHAWVQSQLLWNPKQDDRKLMREFLDGYFGKAAKPIQQYLDLMAAAAKDFDMVIWTGPDAPFFSLDTMLKAEQLWKNAEQAVAGDKDLTWRVRIGHLPVKYVFLSRWVPFQREASERKIAWPLNQSRKAEAAQWLALATGEGPKGWSKVTHMNEGGTKPEIWGERFLLDPVTSPLPGRTAAPLPADLPPGEAIDLQDDLAKLYGEGSLAEFRADPAASDGIACRMPGSHHEWAFQLPLSKAPAKAFQGKWRVFVIARVEPRDQLTGVASFSAGIWDGAAKKSLGQVAPNGKASSTTYRSYEVGTIELTKDCYVWIAPPDHADVKAIWVDRVVLVKAS
jgi:hypothetical protein